MLKKIFWLLTLSAILVASPTWAEPNIGIQGKYITGVGVTLDVPVTKQIYLNGSASWLLLLADI